MNNETLIRSRQWLLNYHRQLLLALICAGLIYSLAEHSYRLMDDLMSEAPERVSQSSENQAKALATTDFELLFGRAEDKPRQSRSADIPATNLNLTLRGALAGSDETGSSAIIQGSDGQDHLYRVGESIPGGATLDSVHPRHVVINYNGRLQKLLFPEAEKNDKTVQGYAVPTSDRPQNLPPGPLHSSAEDQAGEIPETEPGVREQMEQLRQQLEGL